MSRRLSQDYRYQTFRVHPGTLLELPGSGLKQCRGTGGDPY